MAAARLHHVNIHTANLDKMRKFYSTILGLEDGWRPGFSVDGAWLYDSNAPVVHLVDKADAENTDEGRIEHFAFSGDDMVQFISLLKQHSIDCSINDVVETNLQSVNIRDPDGNHIEVLFEQGADH